MLDGAGDRSIAGGFDRSRLPSGWPCAATTWECLTQYPDDGLDGGDRRAGSEADFGVELVSDRHVDPVLDLPFQCFEHVHVVFVGTGDPQGGRLKLLTDAPSCLIPDVYPGFDMLELSAARACLEGCEPDVGFSVFDSQKLHSWLIPILSSWNDFVDREIVCVAGNGDSAPLKASIRGSER